MYREPLAIDGGEILTIDGNSITDNAPSLLKFGTGESQVQQTHIVVLLLALTHIIIVIIMSQIPHSSGSLFFSSSTSMFLQFLTPTATLATLHFNPCSELPRDIYSSLSSPSSEYDKYVILILVDVPIA